MLAILNPIDVEITDEFLPMYSIEERPDGGYIFDAITGYCIAYYKNVATAYFMLREFNRDC
jgi:hypothetical protein